MDSTRQIPMFLAHFNDVDGSEKLYLPEAWCSHMRRSILSEAFLRDRHGNIWPVKVATYLNTEKFWFEEGWSRFVEENNLADNDRISFQFDGDSTFHFVLFDKNGVEKVFPNPQELVEQEELHENQAEPRERPTMQPEREAEEMQSMEAELREPPTMQPEREAEEMQSMEAELREPPTMQAEHELEEFQDTRAELASTEEEPDSEAVTTVGRKRARIIVKKDEEAIFRSGFPRPNNPCFATKRSTQNNMLIVPKRLWRDFEMALPAEIEIHDEKGNVWSSKVQMWRDKRLWISNAWKSFSESNQVKDDDWFIVEIVRPVSPGAQIYLIIRLVPQPTIRAAGLL